MKVALALLIAGIAIFLFGAVQIGSGNKALVSLAGVGIVLIVIGGDHMRRKHGANGNAR
jgi:hypothetical protein